MPSYLFSKVFFFSGQSLLSWWWLAMLICEMANFFADVGAFYARPARFIVSLPAS